MCAKWTCKVRVYMLKLKKVLKKDFKQLFCKYPSAFLACTHREVPVEKLVQAAREIPSMTNITFRKAKENSTGLVFFNEQDKTETGSVLNLSSKGSSEVQVYNLENTPIYVVHEMSVLQYHGFEPEVYNKYMYYFLCERR